MGDSQRGRPGKETASQHDARGDGITAIVAAGRDIAAGLRWRRLHPSLRCLAGHRPVSLSRLDHCPDLPRAVNAR